MLRHAVAARPWLEPAGQGDVEALYQIAVLWRGFDTEADPGALVAVCDAQQPEAGIGRCLQVALPAARQVSVALLREQGWKGAELGQRLAAARRAAMSAGLKAAGLLT